MGRKKKVEKPLHPRYRDWLAYTFESLPPNANIGSAFDNDNEPWIGDVSEKLELTTTTLTRSGTDLLKYTDAQVAIGLESIFNYSLSNDGHDMVRDDLELSEQVVLFQAIALLYRDCLSLRAPDALGHLNEGEGPLSTFCYMFWDTSIVGYWEATERNAERVDALFVALQAGLGCANHACMESALHGIGHLHASMAGRGRACVEQFLNAKRNNIRPELASYASRAADQMVQ